MGTKDESKHDMRRDLFLAFMTAVFMSIVPLAVQSLLSWLSHIGQIQIPTALLIIATVLISATILVGVFFLGAYLGILWFMWSILKGIMNWVEQSAKNRPKNFSLENGRVQGKDE